MFEKCSQVYPRFLELQFWCQGENEQETSLKKKKIPGSQIFALNTARLHERQSGWG